MKQISIGHTLYVFDNEAYEVIDHRDDDIIYVPEDHFDEYVEANADLAEKMRPMNYNVIHSKMQDWEPYYYGGGGEKQDPEIAWEFEWYDPDHPDATAVEDEQSSLPTLSNPHSVEGIRYTSSDEGVATVDENYNITLVGDGDTTISAVFDGDDNYNASTVTYLLHVQMQHDITWTDEWDQLSEDLKSKTRAHTSEWISGYEKEDADDLYGNFKVVGTYGDVEEINVYYPNADHRREVAFYMPAGDAQITCSPINNGYKEGADYRLNFYDGDNMNVGSEFADLYNKTENDIEAGGYFKFNDDNIANAVEAEAVENEEQQKVGQLWKHFNGESFDELFYIEDIGDDQFTIQPRSLGSFDIRFEAANELYTNNSDIYYTVNTLEDTIYNDEILPNLVDANVLSNYDFKKWDEIGADYATLAQGRAQYAEDTDPVTSEITTKYVEYYDDSAKLFTVFAERIDEDAYMYSILPYTDEQDPTASCPLTKFMFAHKGE